MSPMRTVLALAALALLAPATAALPVDERQDVWCVVYVGDGTVEATASVHVEADLAGSPPSVAVTPQGSADVTPPSGSTVYPLDPDCVFA